MLRATTVLLSLQSRGPHGPTTGDCIGELPENARGRGLHVGSVSSRTSNTHQRSAPRRYVQKWRSSCSAARRRRRSPSPTLANVVTSRTSSDLVEPRGPSPWRSQRKYYQLAYRAFLRARRLRGRVDACVCTCVRVFPFAIRDDEYPPDERDVVDVVRRSDRAVGLTNRWDSVYQNASAKVLRGDKPVRSNRRMKRLSDAIS